jgi:hypothetical protein
MENLMPDHTSPRHPDALQRGMGNQNATQQTTNHRAPSDKTWSEDEKAAMALALNCAMTRVDPYKPKSRLDQVMQALHGELLAAGNAIGPAAAPSAEERKKLTELWNTIGQSQKSEQVALKQGQRQLYAAEIAFLLNRYRNFFSHAVAGEEPNLITYPDKLTLYGFTKWLGSRFEQAANAHGLTERSLLIWSGNSPDRDIKQGRFTKTSVVFLVSFFLTRSQMNLLLSRLTGFKDSRRKALRKVMSHFSLRDGRVDPLVQENPHMLIREVIGYLALPFAQSDEAEAKLEALQRKKAETLQANLVNRDRHDEAITPFPEWKPPTFREEDKFVIYAMKLIDQLGWFWNDNIKLRFWCYSMQWQADESPEGSVGLWHIVREPRQISAKGKTALPPGAAQNPYTSEEPKGQFARALESNETQRHIYWLNDDNIRFSITTGDGDPVNGVMRQAEFANLLFLRWQAEQSQASQPDEKLLNDLLNALEKFTQAADTGRPNEVIQTRNLPKSLRHASSPAPLKERIAKRLEQRIARIEDLLGSLKHNTAMREARHALRPARPQPRGRRSSYANNKPDFVQAYLSNVPLQLSLHEQAHEVLHFIQRLEPKDPDKFSRRDFAQLLGCLFQYNADHANWCRKHPRQGGKPPKEVYQPASNQFWKLWRDRTSVPSNGDDTFSQWRNKVLANAKQCVRLHDLFECVLRGEREYMIERNQALNGLNATQQTQLAAYLGLSTAATDREAARKRTRGYAVIPAGYFQRVTDALTQVSVSTGLKPTLLNTQPLTQQDGSPRKFGTNFAQAIRKAAQAMPCQLEQHYYRIAEEKLHLMPRAEGRKRIAALNQQATHDSLLLMLTTRAATQLSTSLPQGTTVTTYAANPVEEKITLASGDVFTLRFEHIYQQKREWMMFKTRPKAKPEEIGLAKLLRWSRNCKVLKQAEIDNKTLEAKRLPELRSRLEEARYQRIKTILEWEHRARSKYKLDPKHIQAGPTRNYLKLEDYLKKMNYDSLQTEALIQNRNGCLHDDIPEDFNTPALPTL